MWWRWKWPKIGKADGLQDMDSEREEASENLNIAMYDQGVLGRTTRVTSSNILEAAISLQIRFSVLHTLALLNAHTARAIQYTQGSRSSVNPNASTHPSNDQLRCNPVNKRNDPATLQDRKSQLKPQQPARVCMTKEIVQSLLKKKAV
jgi:hypothetical protein